MSPIGLLSALAAGWALLRFWLVPLTKDRWNAADLKSKMARAGSLVVLEKVRDLAGFGAIAIAATLAFVQIAGWIGGSDAKWPRAVIGATSSLYAALKSISEGYGLALTMLGLTGAAVALWLAARRAKQRVVEVWMKEANATFQSLQSDLGQIEEARQDPALAPQVAAVDAAIAQIIAQGEPTAENARQLDAARDVLGQAMSSLAIAWSGRRIDIPELAGKPEEAPVGSGTLWQRLARVLSSRKLGEDLGIVRKPLGRVITGLLFVSLLGWSSEPLANSLRLSLNNMRVGAAQDQAQRDLDGAMSRLPPAPPAAKTDKDEAPTAASPAVQRASQLVARGVMRDMIRRGLIAPPPGRGAALQGHDQADVVRAALLGETVDPESPHAAVRQAAADAVAAGDGRGAAHAEAHIRREIEPVLQQIAARDPRRLDTLLARLEARYATPMSVADAQGKLTEKIIDEVFSSIDAKPADELGKQAQKLGKEFGKKTVQTWVDAQTKQFVTLALSDAALPEVERAMFLESRRSTRDMLVSLRAPEAQVWRASAATSKEIRAASAVSDMMAEADDGPGRRPRTPAGYDDLFPASTAPIPPEPPAGGGGGVGGGGGERFSRARASSFHLASSSFRARGVIVGRPMTGRALDVNDIRWSIAAPVRAGQPHRVAVSLRIVDARGAAAWRPIGSFDAGVLNQGVRYAADRRVVATTIIAGDGRVVGRQTSLHPVLADTPLGCRVVASDRLVDTFSFSRPGIGLLTMDRVAMGDWLEVAKMAEVGSSAPSCPVGKLREYAKAAKLQPVRFSPAMRRSIDSFMAGLGRATPGSEVLLRHADRCATGPTARLADCLCANPPSLPARYWYPEDHTSQVRERQAPLTADLAWLRGSAQGLGNLDFITHTTFAVHVRDTAEVDETTAYTFLFPASELTALRQEVVRRTPGFVASELNGPSYDDFVRPLEEFVLVQRLARAALDGQLGRDFPLAKLIALERATRRYVPSQPTLRWEPRDVQGFARKLAETDPDGARLFQAAYTDQATRMRDGRPMCAPASR